MALTIDNFTRIMGGAGNRNIYICDIDFDTSYPTGGEALAPATVGMQSFDLVMVAPDAGYVFEFDYTNNLLLAYWADNDAGSDTALVQVADTTNLSGVANARALIIGV